MLLLLTFSAHTPHHAQGQKCTPRQLAHPKQQTDLFLRPRVTQVGGGKRVFRRLHITQAVHGPFRCTYAYEHSTVSLHHSSTAGTRAESAPLCLHRHTHVPKRRAAAQQLLRGSTLGEDGSQPAARLSVISEAQVPHPPNSTHAQEKHAGQGRPGTLPKCIFAFARS